MFYHYTSRENGAEILAQGRLRLGRSRRIYVTRDVYLDGDAATNSLSITGKPIEVVFVVPDERVINPRPDGGAHVERIILQDEELRPGCGMEWYTESEIDVTDLECKDLRTKV